MADYSSNMIDTSTPGINIDQLFFSAVREADRNGFVETVSVPTSGIRMADRSYVSPMILTSNYYLMRAVDPDAATLTYRTWIVTGSPDANGAQYTGVKSGNNALTNIVVMANWSA